MDAATLTQVADALEARAATVMIQTGGHIPHGFAWFADGRMEHALFTQWDEAGKDAATAVLRLWASEGALACALVSEAWAVVGKTDAELALAMAWKAEHGTLESYPGRRELLVVEVASRGGHEVRSLPVRRIGQEVRLGQSETAPSGSLSRFLSGLWEANRG